MSLYFLPLGATNKTISGSHGDHDVKITLRQKDELKTIRQNMKVQVYEANELKVLKI